MSRVLEDILVRYELPYQVIGGTKFYERAEIKDAIAYLQPAGQPGRRGQLLARRQLARGAGIGDTSQGRLRSPREHHRPDDLGGVAASPRRSRAWVPPRSRRSAASSS